MADDRLDKESLGALACCFGGTDGLRGAGAASWKGEGQLLGSPIVAAGNTGWRSFVRVAGVFSSVAFGVYAALRPPQVVCSKCLIA